MWFHNRANIDAINQQRWKQVMKNVLISSAHYNPQNSCCMLTYIPFAFFFFPRELLSRESSKFYPMFSFLKSKCASEIKSFYPSDIYIPGELVPSYGRKQRAKLEESELLPRS